MSAAAVRGPREISLLSHRIVVGRGALRRVGGTAAALSVPQRFALISDENVATRYGPAVERSLGANVRSFTIAPGESQKTRDTWARVTDEMIAAGFGRDTCVVALGGGVVGDLAGFVAATYMRGVALIQVPTSLLAMIDASIGGKTGVDTPAGKNLVGAFHQPAAVVADPDVLSTLPPEHLRAGLAEAIKHGVISDAAYFESISSYLRAQPSNLLDIEWLTEIVVQGIAIKASVVTSDEREQGVRKTLNFGHTIGHAIELLSDYRMLHGEAVAIGMSVEADIAERVGVADRGTATAIRSVLRQAGLPIASDFPVEDVLKATRTDKKAREGRVEYALPMRVGAMGGADSGWSVPVPDTIVQQALDASV